MQRRKTTALTLLAVPGRQHKQCLEQSLSNRRSWWRKCCHSPSFAVRQGSQTLPWLRTARDGGRRCTNLYDYLHIHTYTQNHSHAHTHIHADAQEHTHRHPNRQILRHRDTYTVLLSCNTITCTEHMRVQIHLHVPLEVPQLYLHIELNWHIESMCTYVCIYISIHMRDIYNTYTLYTVNMWWQIHIQLQNARTYLQACHVDVNLPVHRYSHVLKKFIQRQIHMYALTFAIRNQVWNPDSEIKFWIGNKNAGLVALESNKLSERLVWAANAKMNRSLSSHLIFRGKQCAKHRHGSIHLRSS